MTYFKMNRPLPEEAAEIRREVFMEEQGFAEEFDDIDQCAYHVVLYENDAPIGTCRFFWDEERAAYVIGRLAVRKAFRGSAFGASLLRETEEQIGRLNGHIAYLAAQVQAKPFYERQGYTAVGAEFLDEHCPHIWMCKELPAAR